MFKTLSRDGFLIVIITPITLVNKILLFIVPRTSLDELSSTYYAEFRYVDRFFIGQDFKDSEEFKCAK